MMSILVPKDAKEYSWIVKGLLTRRLVQGASRILDIGCGRGGQTARLKNAVGLDVDLPRLRFAKSISDNDFVLAHANWLPFRDDSFDRVIMSEVIEHLPDQSGAVEEVDRVLSAYGRFLIQTPDRRITLGIFIHRIHGHVHEFTPRDLNSFLLEHGFETIFRTGSTIPYIPSTSRLQRLNHNRAFFRIWRLLNAVLPLTWDIIVLAKRAPAL